MNFELIFKEDADKNLISLENLNLKKFYKKYNIYNYPKNKLDTMLYLEERNLNLEKSNNSKIRYISGGGDYTLEVFKIKTDLSPKDLRKHLINLKYPKNPELYKFYKKKHQEQNNFLIELFIKYKKIKLFNLIEIMEICDFDVIPINLDINVFDACFLYDDGNFSELLAIDKDKYYHVKWFSS
jgi:hypothetical protein